MRDIDLTQKNVSLAETNHLATRMIIETGKILDIDSKDRLERILVLDVLSDVIQGHKNLYYCESHRVISNIIEKDAIEVHQKKSIVLNNLKKSLKKINDAIRRTQKVGNDIKDDRAMIFENMKGVDSAQQNEDFQDHVISKISNAVYEIVSLYLVKTEEIEGSVIPCLLVEVDKDEPCIKHKVDDKYYKPVYR